MKIQSVPELYSFLAMQALRDARVKTFFMGTTEQWLDFQKANAQYPCVYAWMPEVDMGLNAAKGKPFISYLLTLEVHDQPTEKTDRWAATAQSEDIMRDLLKRLYMLRANGVIDQLEQPGDTNYAPFTTPDGTVGWDAQLIIGTYTGSMCSPEVRPLYSVMFMAQAGATTIQVVIDGTTYSAAWDGDPATLAQALHDLSLLLIDAGYTVWPTPSGLVINTGSDELTVPTGAGIHFAEVLVGPASEDAAAITIGPGTTILLPDGGGVSAGNTSYFKVVADTTGQVPVWNQTSKQWEPTVVDALAADDISSTTISLAVDTDITWAHEFGLARITTNGAHRFNDFTAKPAGPLAPFIRTAIITITNPGDHIILFPTTTYHAPEGDFPTDTVAGEQIDVTILWTGVSYRVRIVRNVAVIPDTTPQATGVTITGIAVDGNLLSHDYDFVSIEGDTESGSISFARRYASEAAALADETGTAGELYLPSAAVNAGTTRTYTATSADVGKYHVYFVRPQDDGINPGGVLLYRSEVFGPVAAAPADPTVVSVVTSAQIAPGGTTIPPTNLAFAGSTAGANGKAIVFFVGDRNGGGSSPSGTANGVTSATLGGVPLTPITRRNHNAGNNGSVSLFELPAASFPADGTLPVAGVANMHMGDMIVGIILLRNANQANVANFTSANGGSSTTMTLSLLSVAVNSLLLTVGGQASGGNWLTPTSGQSVESETPTASSNVEVYSERATVAGGFTETISIGSASGGAAAIMLEIRTV